MSELSELAHFLYGRGFWYADPLKEIGGLTEDQLFCVPDPKGLCMLWQVGHIAHREKVHIGWFLQGLEGTVIPPKFEVFGPDWCPVEDVRTAMDTVEGVLEWARGVREESHAYIASLSDADYHKATRTSDGGMSVAHWLFITTAHTALHIGRIQLLRALVESTYERAC